MTGLLWHAWGPARALEVAAALAGAAGVAILGWDAWRRRRANVV
jgi:hypothetical protein